MFLRAAHRPCSKSKQHWRPLVLNSSARQRIGRASALPHRRLKTDGESPNRGVEFNGGGPGFGCVFCQGKQRQVSGANYGFSRLGRPSQSRFGVEFTDENGGGPGVRLPQAPKAARLTRWYTYIELW